MLMRKQWGFGGTPQHHPPAPPENQYWIDRRWVKLYRGAVAYELTLGPYPYTGPWLSLYYFHQWSFRPGFKMVEIGFVIRTKHIRKLRELRWRLQELGRRLKCSLVR